MSKRKYSKDVGKKTKTQQQFKDDNNPAVIMKKFVQTGVPPLGNGKKPMFLDLSQMGDFTEHLNHVTRVQQDFMQLAPQIRAKFDNDPAKLLNFVSDNKNLDEGVLMGLLEAPKGWIHPDRREGLKSSGAKSSTPEEAENGSQEESGEASKTA